jgi:hypothetical protein
MTRGVIYYNRGQKMLVRLAVSIESLRRHYDGPVTILSQGDDSHKACEYIADRWGIGANVKRVDWPDEKKRQTYLNATLSHQTTPYDTTMWLDSDTLVRGTFAEMFEAAEANEFAISQIANWTVQKKIGKRVLDWAPLYPDWIKPALDFKPAINCGVFAFVKESALMRDWYKLAEPGRDLSWIPDETCCQLILHRYPHKIMDQKYNVSCKHSNPYDPDARIIHYHGRKHCRMTEKDGVTFCLHGAWLWYRMFEVLRGDKTVEGWVRKDRQLRQNLSKWDGWKRQNGDRWFEAENQADYKWKS